MKESGEKRGEGKKRKEKRRGEEKGDRQADRYGEPPGVVAVGELRQKRAVRGPAHKLRNSTMLPTHGPNCVARNACGYFSGLRRAQKEIAFVPGCVRLVYITCFIDTYLSKVCLYTFMTILWSKAWAD